MPYYTILGITVFIPDFNDLVNFVVAPLNDAVNRVRDFILSGIQALLGDLVYFVRNIADFLYRFVVVPISNFINTYILPVLNQAWQAITNLGQGIYNAVNGVVNFILNGINTARDYIINFINSYILPAFNQITNFFSGLINQAAAAIQNIISGIQAGITNLGQGIYQVLQAAWNSITDAVNKLALDLGHGISTVGEYVSNAFNQLATGINSIISEIVGGLKTFAQDAYNFLDNYVFKPIAAGLQQVGAAITSAVQNFHTNVARGIVALLPKSPEEALFRAIDAVALGYITFVAGEVIAITADAVHPFKALGVQNMLHKSLDLLGVSAIAGSLYSIIVHSGFGLQLQYYFNYQLQPRRPSADLGAEAVHHQVINIDKYREILRYEGYNDEAIELFVRTLYRPLPPFLLKHLWETGVIDDDFIRKNLLQAGFDPADVPQIIRALQAFKLSPVSATARSLIYEMYREGYFKADVAEGMLRALGATEEQIRYILSLAREEFRYTQAKLIRQYVLDLAKKGVIDANEAIDLITGLGFDRERSTVLVKIALALALPAPTKEQRQALLQQLLALESLA